MKLNGVIKVCGRKENSYRSLVAIVIDQLNQIKHQENCTYKA